MEPLDFTDPVQVHQIEQAKNAANQELVNFYSDKYAGWQEDQAEAFSRSVSADAQTEPLPQPPETDDTKRGFFR